MGENGHHVVLGTGPLGQTVARAVDELAVAVTAVDRSGQLTDHSKFAETVDADPTPHEEAIERTLAWYHD